MCVCTFIVVTSNWVTFCHIFIFLSIIGFQNHIVRAGKKLKKKKQVNEIGRVAFLAGFAAIEL